MSSSSSVPRDLLTDSVRANLAWLRTMMPAPDGSQGIWERLRLDMDEPRVFRVRPDCSAEAALLFHRAAEHLDEAEFADIGVRMYEFILGMAREDGSFPFYELVVPAGASTDDGASWNLQYPNDHGKLLELLCLLQQRTPHDRFDVTARGIADYLIAGQEEDGSYSLAGVAWPGPCFVAWAVIGLVRYFEYSEDERIRESAIRAIDYLRGQQFPDGRLRTSYEVSGAEAWRPASSETAETLRAFALAQRVLKIDLSQPIAGATAFLDRLTTTDGAIRNCDSASASASLQNDQALTDLVYTAGYALHAWIDTANTTTDGAPSDHAVRLATFLAGIQDPDGSWRGSYDVDRRGWRGRANQRNDIDEGGEFSVYTGWCNATIANGMLRLLER